MSDLVLNNVELYWARLDPNNPDKGFDGNTPQWKVDLRTRDKGKAKEWKDLGLNVKTDDDSDGVFYKTTLKKPTHTKKGTENRPVAVLDRNLFAFEDVNSIGNGTVANVSVHSFEYNYGGREGVGFRLNGIQVVDLVEYKGSSGNNKMGFTQLEVPEETVDEDIY